MGRLSDLARSKIETTRRFILRSLYVSGQIGTNEEMILTALQSARYPTLKGEIRLLLDYLEQKNLAKIEDRERDVWHIFITAQGIDVLEGAVPVPPGIAKG